MNKKETKGWHRWGKWNALAPSTSYLPWKMIRGSWRWGYKSNQRARLPVQLDSKEQKSGWVLPKLAAIPNDSVFAGNANHAGIILFVIDPLYFKLLINQRMIGIASSTLDNKWEATPRRGHFKIFSRKFVNGKAFHISLNFLPGSKSRSQYSCTEFRVARSF